MKLAFSTLPCAGWPLDKVLRMCTDNAIQGLEIRLGLNDWAALDMAQDTVAAVAQGLRQHGIVVPNLGTSLVVRQFEWAQLQALQRCARVAQGLGASGLRIMLGSYKVRYPDVMPDADFGGIVRWLKEAAAMAQDHGVEIWLETHNEFASGQAMRRVLDAVRAPQIKILWDVIHPLEVGESIASTLDFMAGDIAHVHIKDGLPWEDPDLANWRYTRLGEGVIPLAEMVAALQRRGYAGFYSLEWESTWRPEIRGPGFDGETVIPHFAQTMRDLAR